jgi:hypothetical protein
VSEAFRPKYVIVPPVDPGAVQPEGERDSCAAPSGARQHLVTSETESPRSRHCTGVTATSPMDCPPSGRFQRVAVLRRTKPSEGSRALRRSASRDFSSSPPLDGNCGTFAASEPALAEPYCRKGLAREARKGMRGVRRRHSHNDASGCPSIVGHGRPRDDESRRRARGSRRDRVGPTQ